MATVTGYVERIKYRNEDNGYSVLSVADGGEEYILVGTFPYISEGERIEATGRMVEHSIYGEQLAVESYEIKAPEDTLAIERYLGSGAIKGIGAALAKRIVKKFKADTFRIMEEEPERLAEVKGVSERMAMDRIAAAEASALAEVRRAAAEVATQAAREVIAAKFDAQADAALVDRSVAELPKALRAA